jgi:hypothetical protein
MRRLLIIIVLAILYGSFYPWHFAYVPGNFFLVPIDFSDKKDLILNFWLYAPVGACAYWVFKRAGALRWILPVCVGFALSTFVELVQFFVVSRLSSKGDIFANTLGTAAGMLAAALVGYTPELSRWRLRRSPETVLLGFWLAFLVFPFFPVHGLYSLMVNVRKFQASPFVWTDLLVFTIGWCVVWQLIPSAFVRDTYWLAVGFLLLLLPARLFLILRVLTKPEVVAGAAALCIAPFFRRRIIPPWVMAALILTALMIRGLAPFEISAFAAPFSWVPFSGFLGSQWQSAMLVLIAKLFWYAAAVWSLRRCGLGLAMSGVVVAVLLAGIEIIQRHMPAHVPEITDPLLALGCAAALGLVSRVPIQPSANQGYVLQQR